MNQSSSSSGSRGLSSRRLEQAIEYVERGWFPASPQSVRIIQERSARGEYRGNFELLLSDLKNDFALFTYLLKGIRSEYPRDNSLLEPVAVLRTMDIEKILKLVSVPIDTISSHSIGEMEKVQASTLKNLILGSTTTSLLAEKKKSQVNEDQVFTLYVIRQLGLNLISWNYPSIYGRALQSVKGGSEEEFDDILSNQLGFRPIELAASLTLPEHAIIHYENDLGLVKPSTEGINEPSIARKLCEIGEAFAILNDPEHSPTATPEARSNMAEVEAILGPNAQSLIHSTIKKNQSNYLQTSPQLVQLISASRDSLNAKANPYGKALLGRNPYVSKLPDGIKSRLADVYDTLRKGQVSTEGVQLLATDILPSLGFHRGCIFLVEQKELTLTPRLRIGTDKVSRYRPLSCFDPGLESNPVVHAFSCSYPVRETGIVFLGDRVSLVAGALGVSERAGVLYLEMTDALVAGSKYDPMTVFKALRHCLNDCLSLR